MAEKRKEVYVGDCDLPSLELGKLIDLSDPNQVKRFMSQKGLNIPQGYQQFLSSSEPTLPSNRFTRSTGELSQGLNKATKAKHTTRNKDKQAVSKSQTDYTNKKIVLSEDVVMAMPSRFSNTSSNTESSDSSFLPTESFCQTNRDPDINTINWVDHDKGQSGIAFSDGNAIVIEDDLVVIGDESDMFGEGLQQQEELDEKSSKPEVIVRTEDYHRFRYMSEMGNRGNKRVFENHDGKEFVSIHVKYYCGSVKVLMFCVDIEGKPHPFYLEGEHCENGLFSDIYTVNQNLIIRIKQINIICPTHKQYNDSLKNLREALRQHESCHEWPDCSGVKLKAVDKSKVRLRVEVIFENEKQSIVQLSDPIQDRKQGMDFKIHTVRDPSAPASGSLEGNPVLIVTTNDTNFPKNVDVVLYDNNGWEVKADPSSVEIIKKCVVIFHAPPYTKDRNIKGNVTVSLALLDRDTGKRTPPVDFLYYVDSDVYGVKSKKRKLDSLQESSHQNPSEMRTASQANNNVLQFVKKKLGNKRRTKDETTISAEMVQNAITDSSQEMSDMKSTLKDEPEVVNIPAFNFSQMGETQELLPDYISTFLLQLEQFGKIEETCNSEQNSVPVSKQPHTLSKGKLSLTPLPNGMLRIFYKGKEVGDITHESWLHMIQKKRHQQCSQINASANLANDNQHIYPQQCFYENTSMTNDSQKQNPAVGNQQTLEGLAAAFFEQQAQQFQQFKQIVSEKIQQQSGDIKNEGHDVLGSLTAQQFSVIPQHPDLVTLAHTEDNAFNASDNPTIFTLIQVKDGKYYPSSNAESHQIIEYQPTEDDESQKYIIQDLSAVPNLSLSFNQTTTPTHQMIEGQPVLVQHIQQHPTDEYSPTNSEQFKQTAPWIQGDASSSNGSTYQLFQADTSNMQRSSPYMTNSFQEDHNYSDLPSSDLECDSKVQPGDNSIIIKEDLADDDLEYDTVPMPVIEVEV